MTTPTPEEEKPSPRMFMAMLAAMAAAVGLLMAIQKPLDRLLGHYAGLAVGVLLSVAAYTVVSRLLAPKPPNGT